MKRRLRKSFSKSSFLVQDNWWKTFGIILLITIAVDFAISIVSVPISFIFMWDFISQSLQNFAGGGLEENTPAYYNMISSLGLAMGMIILLTTFLGLLITPLFNVVLYFDLRIRKNDFPDDTQIDDSINPEPSFE